MLTFIFSSSAIFWISASRVCTQVSARRSRSWMRMSSILTLCLLQMASGTSICAILLWWHMHRGSPIVSNSRRRWPDFSRKEGVSARYARRSPPFILALGHETGSGSTSFLVLVLDHEGVAYVLSVPAALEAEEGQIAVCLGIGLVDRPSPSHDSEAAST